MWTCRMRELPGYRQNISKVINNPAAYPSSQGGNNQNKIHSFYYSINDNLFPSDVSQL